MAAQDVLSIAQQYLHRVKKTGNQNVMAICPYHLKNGLPEHDPSFCLSLTSGLWICFSCKKAGNLEMLLHDFGVPGSVIHTQYRYVLEEAAQNRPARFDPLRPRCVVIDGVLDPGGAEQEPLPESFLGLFDQCPLALLDEGFRPDVLASFDVGFDDAHHRITFPLRDLKGNLIGISGRTVIDDRPRYKVYDVEYERWGLPRRDTKKGLILWNAHRIYKEVFNRSDAAVVLVEGFKACMWLVQAGFTHTLALMGSFMSDPQQWILERLGATVYIMLDNDEAGRSATLTIAKKLSRSLPVRVAQYDKQKSQPSDLTQDEVAEALQQAKDYHLWAVERE